MGDDHNKKKIEPWRLVAFAISVAFIIFMWIKKDIADLYATMPSEQIAPLIVTTVLVSLLKVAAIAGGVFIIKWVVDKTRK